MDLHAPGIREAIAEEEVEHMELKIRDDAPYKRGSMEHFRVTDMANRFLERLVDDELLIGKAFEYRSRIQAVIDRYVY